MSDCKKVTISVNPKHGDKYCAMLGVNLMEGVCGFGRTIDESIDAFCESWIGASPMERERAIESLLKTDTANAKLSKEVYQEVIDWMRGFWSELLARLPDDVETVDRLYVEIGVDRSFGSTSSLEASQSHEAFIDGRFPKDIQMSYSLDSIGDWRFQVAHRIKHLDLNGRMPRVIIGRFCEEWTLSSPA